MYSSFTHYTKVTNWAFTMCHDICKLHAGQEEGRSDGAQLHWILSSMLGLLVPPGSSWFFTITRAAAELSGPLSWLLLFPGGKGQKFPFPSELPAVACNTQDFMAAILTLWSPGSPWRSGLFAFILLLWNSKHISTLNALWWRERCLINP